MSEAVYSEEQLGQQVEKIEKKYIGLKVGATTILLILGMAMLFNFPLYLSFLDKGLVFMKMFLIPDSFILILIMAIYAFFTTFKGLYLSIKYFNWRGLLLSLFAFFFYLGLGTSVKDTFDKYSSISSEIQYSKLITIEDRDKYQEIFKKTF